MVKKTLVAILLRALRHGLKNNHDPLDALLGHALGAYFGVISQARLRDELARYYSELSIPDLLECIDYPAAKARVVTDGYKTDLVDHKSAGKPIWMPQPVWDKKLALLRHARVRLDLLTLSEGASIPPHLHRGVVSGFMLLEGRAAIRHYDISRYNRDSVLARMTVDEVLEPGQYTVNSDAKDNVHWLLGVADRSILYRFNITGLPSELPEYGDLAGRLYIDTSPISAPSEQPVKLRFATEEEARAITFERRS